MGIEEKLSSHLVNANEEERDNNLPFEVSSVHRKLHIDDYSKYKHLDTPSTRAQELVHEKKWKNAGTGKLSYTKTIKKLSIDSITYNGKELFLGVQFQFEKDVYSNGQQPGRLTVRKLDPHKTLGIDRILELDKIEEQQGFNYSFEHAQAYIKKVLEKLLENTPEKTITVSFNKKIHSLTSSIVTAEDLEELKCLSPNAKRVFAGQLGLSSDENIDARIIEKCIQSNMPESHFSECIARFKEIK